MLAVLAVLVAPVGLIAQTDLEPRVPVTAATTLGIDYSFAYFQGDLDPWQLGALSITHRRTAGSLIGRLNVARRFSQSGAQVEVDAYPSLGAGAYGYLNVGYSGSTVFPEWRFGGELFRNLPNAYEASLGIRHMRFQGTRVTLSTGSLGRYTGNYWFSLRPYFLDEPNLRSSSVNLTARRYYADGDNYVGGRVGIGAFSNGDVVGDQLGRTGSVTAGVHGSRAVSTRTIGTWLIAYDRETLTGASSRNRWEIAGGAKYRF